MGSTFSIKSDVAGRRHAPNSNINPRLFTLITSILVGVLWVAVLSFLIPEGEESFAGDLLLDRNTQSLSYPFTIQNLMWLIFFIGAGELLIRYFGGGRQHWQLTLKLLPEDRETVLRKKDIGSLYQRVQDTDPENQYWLQRMLRSAMLQFQSSGSIDQVNAVFNSSVGLYHHETELQYSLLRYLVWLIPTLGFIGTVLGIAFALENANSIVAKSETTTDVMGLGLDLMRGLTQELGVAFYTTLLALLQSAVLMFALHLIQSREEEALNKASQYCLENFVNRLYE